MDSMDSMASRVRSASKAPTRSTMPGHAGQESWHRSHFGSRYKSGPCFTAGLLVRRVDSGWRAFWDHQQQQQQQQQHCAATKTTPRGFEPLRAEPNGFLVHLLDRSDTVSPPTLARPEPSLRAGRLAGTAGTLEAVESRETLEISETAETMETSSACEAVETLARGVYKASQQLFKGCSKAAARFPEGVSKALTKPAQGFHRACARCVPVSCQVVPANA